MDSILRPLLISLRPGQHRVICPVCEPGRKKRGMRELSVHKTHDKAIYQCHHCGISGKISMNESNIVRLNASERYEYEGNHKTYSDNQPKTTNEFLNNIANRPPKAEVKELQSPPTDTYVNHYDYLLSRGISRATADAFGCKTEQHYIRAAGGVVPCLVLPYGEYSKYRALNVKGFAYDGTAKHMFAIDKYQSGDLVITEGEIDTLSFAEAGIQAVSIPHGAKLKYTTDSNLEYLFNAKEKLDKAGRIVLACDSDEPGKATAEEIARRVGKHRVWQVIWPEDCKDGNDVLVKYGAEKLAELVESAEPWPVSGLYGADHFYSEVLDAYENGLAKGESTGYPLVDELYTIGPGQVTIVTGIPGSGKSEFIDQLMVNLAESKDWTFAICSFENEPRIHIAKLMSKRLRKGFWDKKLPQDEFKRGFQWVQDHFAFLYDRDGKHSTLEGILERLETAVLRYGIRGAVIDPYNYIRRPKDFAETDWISDMLTQVKMFAMAHGVHIWFVAHPTKLPREADGTVKPPTGYSISGSHAWFDKADMGLTIHRPFRNEEVEAIIWKVRFQWQGKEGKTVLIYDKTTTRYGDGTEDSIPQPAGKMEWEYDNHSGLEQRRVP